MKRLVTAEGHVYAFLAPQGEAPLKPTGGYGEDAPAPDFPRPTRRGPIEATDLPNSTALPRATFLAPQGEAPLKLSGGGNGTTRTTMLSSPHKARPH